MSRKARIALFSAAALLILLIGGLVSIRLSLESLVTLGVNTIGPKITGTRVSLGGISFKLLRGELTLKNFELGNPQDYSTPYALKADTLSIRLVPSSLLKEKIIINDITITGVDLYYEQGLSGSNLTAIKDNVDTFVKSLSSQEKKEEASSTKPMGKKLQVDNLSISGINVHLSIKGLGGNALPTPVPPIALSNIGSGPEGITPAELGATILDNLLSGVLSSVNSVIPSLKGTTEALGNGAGKVLEGTDKVVDGAKGAVDSVMGIFK